MSSSGGCRSTGGKKGGLEGRVDDSSARESTLNPYGTVDALPIVEHYRPSILGAQRPTLQDMNAPDRDAPIWSTVQTEEEIGEAKKQNSKLGWIKGVLTKCLLSIWGVIMFLRMPWILGETGLTGTLIMLVVANLITLLTSLSMCAIATNGEIEGGGLYYIISRTLGRQWGAVTGVLYTSASIIAGSLYIIGAVECLQMIMRNERDSVMLDGGITDIRVVGTVILVLLVVMAMIGLSWISYMEILLLAVMVLAQLLIVIGVFIGPTSDLSIARGFVGMNSRLLAENLTPDFRQGTGLAYAAFNVFGVLFPAVSGVVAGVNISGDLKDPRTAIPRGTLLAMAITFMSYILYPILMAASVVRDASGNVTELQDFLYNDTGYLNGTKSILDAPTFVNCYTPNKNSSETVPCQFGLSNSNLVMEEISAFGYLTYAGCLAATLSSAVSFIVGAPRILQAMAKDRAFGKYNFFELSFKSNNEPYVAYIFVYLLTQACIIVGDLNIISGYLTNFFLASYFMINISCIFSSACKSPGWRPSFKFYSKWMGGLGALMCLASMFVIDWRVALGTGFATMIVHLMFFGRKNEDEPNWGPSTQDATFNAALKFTMDLQAVEPHVKNFRPQILVLSGMPECRPSLVDLAHTLTKNQSTLCIGNILINMTVEWKARENMLKRITSWLRHYDIQAFPCITEATDIKEGVRNMAQLVGLGQMKPNMLMMGYKNDWRDCDRMEMKAYFDIINVAFSMRMGVAYLRMPNGLDYSDTFLAEAPPSTPAQSCESLAMSKFTLHPVSGEDTTSGTGSTYTAATQRRSTRTPYKTIAMDYVRSRREKCPPVLKEQRIKQLEKEREEIVAKLGKEHRNLHRREQLDLSLDLIDEMTYFRRIQGKGTIDVWWTYDDGGLTLIMAYIISQRSKWAACPIRVFVLGQKKDEIDRDQKIFTSLLLKLRIVVDDIHIVQNAMLPADPETHAQFTALIKPFKGDPADGCTVTDAKLQEFKIKTNRNLRLREALLENSMDANLIIMTMPMLRQGAVPAPLYLAWLEMLSSGMPPFLFVRGNQENVLTVAA